MTSSGVARCWKSPSHSVVRVKRAKLHSSSATSWANDMPSSLDDLLLRLLFEKLDGQPLHGARAEMSHHHFKWLRHLNANPPVDDAGLPPLAIIALLRLDPRILFVTVEPRRACPREMYTVNPSFDLCPDSRSAATLIL